MNLTLKVFIVATGLLLSACVHETQLDTRSLSFTSADKDRDNRLTYGEYQDYLDNEAGMGNAKAQLDDTYDQPNRPKAILLKFQKQDSNRDTYVTRDELGMTP